MGSGRALVVDDDERVAEVCRRVLEGLGLAVETAGSAKEAWERMLAARFDFVLTDIAMADPRAGVTLAEEVRNRWPETDVVSRELEAEKLLRSEPEAAYLLARVSHELRTPVAVSRMAADLLEDEVPRPAGKEVLKRLLASD